MIAIWRRLLQFRAGPQASTFYACAEHKGELVHGPSGLFFARCTDPIEPVDPDDDEPCFFCREGGGE